MKEYEAFLAKLVVDTAILKWPLAFAGALVGYLLPTEAMQASAVGVLSLIAIDTVTGLWAALRTGEPVSSRKAGRIIDKLLAYGSVLAVMAIITHNVPALSSLQGGAVTAWLTVAMFTESISILENAHKLGVKTKWLTKWLKERLKEAQQIGEKKEKD